MNKPWYKERTLWVLVTFFAMAQAGCIALTGLPATLW